MATTVTSTGRNLGYYTREAALSVKCCDARLELLIFSSLLYHHGETGGTAVFLVCIGGEVRGRRAPFLRMFSGVSKVIDMASSVVRVSGSTGLRVFFVPLPRSPRCEVASLSFVWAIRTSLLPQFSYSLYRMGF